MNSPWRVGPLIPLDDRRELRRRMIFDYGKWDPHLSDTEVLAPYAVILHPGAWQEIAHAAETMTREILLAEKELLNRPDLQRRLGMPRNVLSIFRSEAGKKPGPTLPRQIRFDFHWTAQGWRISEANTDVPGGYIEAVGLANLMKGYSPNTQIPYDPGQKLAQGIAEKTESNGLIGLVHATAYTDDRQVMVYLGKEMERTGLRNILLAPDHVIWRENLAYAITSRGQERLSGIVRFFPAEWLANLPRRSGWQRFFAGSNTPISNPGSALLIQSKRLPLVWDEMDCRLDTWRQYLPQTCDIRDIAKPAEEWVFKPALGRVGEDVGIQGITPHREWRKIARHAHWFPGRWIAQRRFEALALETPQGTRYPCLGVYTIAEKACGIYGRVAAQPLINQDAQDVAVLIDNAGHLLNETGKENNLESAACI